MQPDVVLYHSKDSCQQINQSTRQSILTRPNICERNQTRSCEYTARRYLVKANLVFKYMDALPLEKRFSVNGLKSAEKNRLNRFLFLESNASYPVLGSSKIPSGAHLYSQPLCADHRS